MACCPERHCRIPMKCQTPNKKKTSAIHAPAKNKSQWKYGSPRLRLPFSKESRVIVMCSSSLFQLFPLLQSEENRGECLSSCRCCCCCCRRLRWCQNIHSNAEPHAAVTRSHNLPPQRILELAEEGGERKEQGGNRPKSSGGELERAWLIANSRLHLKHRAPT